MLLWLPAQNLGNQPREQRNGRFGTSGRKIRILTNHFQVMCALKQAHQWDVNIVIAPRNQGLAEGQVGGPAPSARPQRRGPQGAQRPMEADTCR